MGNAFVGMAEESFGVDCGCTGSTGTPAPVAANVPSSNAPIAAGESGCSGTDSFTITSGALEAFDGCYLEVPTETAFFTQTGEITSGLVSVFGAYVDQEQTDVRGANKKRKIKK